MRFKGGWAAAVLGVALIAVVWTLIAQRTRSVVSIEVQGGDGGGLPRATPKEEGLDGDAIAAGAGRAFEAGAQALLITRHGHLVFEQYRHGVDAHSPVVADELARLLLTLAAGAVRPPVALNSTVGFEGGALATRISAASHMSYPQFLARAIWQPLNASSARFLASVPGALVRADCCFEAQLLDWLRVGALMLEDGRFEGTQVLPAGWIRRVINATADPGRGSGVWLAPSAVGSEPFASEGVFFIRGSGGTRLWMVPKFDLAVLLVSDARSGPTAVRPDDTRLPNVVMRALHAEAAGGAHGLDALVPGH